MTVTMFFYALNIWSNIYIIIVIGSRGVLSAPPPLTAEDLWFSMLQTQNFNRQHFNTYIIFYPQVLQGKILEPPLF